LGSGPDQASPGIGVALNPFIPETDDERKFTTILLPLFVYYSRNPPGVYGNLDEEGSA
jgi:hypothetical protein